MDIFESLENLPVSESCFEDIISIVEEYINELRDDTVDASTKKRYENRAGAFYKYLRNPSDENWKDYKDAEAKSNKNVDLTLNRDKRHGVFNTDKAGRISKEMMDRNSKKYVNFDSALTKMSQKAINKAENENQGENL